MFNPGNFEPRIDAIVHSALAHMPRADWHRDVVSFNRQRLERLRTAITAWIGARALSNAAFEERLIDPATSSAAIGKLRAVAEWVRTAATNKDLAQASADLASAMQDIGLERWPAFLNDAAERADAYGAVQGNVVLVQVATPNTATDANPGGGPASEAAPGRYVGNNPEQWIGRQSVGTGECVALVQAATGAPLTREWQPGVSVQGNATIRPGTAIATFDSNGRYAGHAAIYVGQDEHGIHVIDQWNIRDSQGHIVGQQPPHERILSLDDPNRARIDRGEFYRVVQ